MGDPISNLVTISCPTHHEKLVDGLWNFFLSHRVVDLDLQWGARSVRAHRVILDVFLSADKLIQTGQHQYHQQQDNSLDSLLEFLYNGTVTLPREQLRNLLTVARESDFKMLVDALESSMVTQDAGPSAGLTKLVGYRKVAPPNIPNPSYAVQLGYGQTGYNPAAGLAPTVVSAPVVQEQPTEAPQPTKKPPKPKKTPAKRDPPPALRPQLQLMSCPHCSFKHRSKDQMLIHQSVHDATLPVHECDFCHKRFSDEPRLERHRSSHTGTWHQCNRCTFKTSDTDRYQEHRAAHHASGTADTVECNSCQRRFRTNAGLARHVRTVHTGVQYHCHHCPYRTRLPDRYRAHLSTHDADHPLSTCETCGKQFPTTVLLDRHVKSTHAATWNQCAHCPYQTKNKMLMRLHRAAHDPTITLLRCQWCNKKLFDQESLDRHKCVRMSGANLHQCPHCAFKTNKLGLFRVHVARHDPNATIVKCTSCERRFADEDSMRRHRCKLSAPDAQPFRCPHCPYTNKFSHQLGYHVLAVHSDLKPFKCQQPNCSYETGRKINLRKHVETTHLDMKPFSCESCPFRTTARAALARHRLTHSSEDERRHKCDQCGRAFRDANTLKRHLRRHAGLDDKTHVCHLCGSAFNRRSNLQVHIRNVHKQVEGTEMVGGTVVGQEVVLVEQGMMVGQVVEQVEVEAPPVVAVVVKSPAYHMPTTWTL